VLTCPYDPFDPRAVTELFIPEATDGDFTVRESINVRKLEDVCAHLDGDKLSVAEQLLRRHYREGVRRGDISSIDVLAA